MQFNAAKSLYKQIKNRLKEQIMSGEYKTGEKIPSERELCEMYGVSRITVRQAINQAVNEGLLYKVQGKGTYITGSDAFTVNQGLVKLTSFGSTFAGRGVEAQTRILSHRIMQADFALSKILNLSVMDQLFNLDLLGLVNSHPMALYHSYFQAAIGLRIHREAEKMVEEGKAFSTMDLYQDYNDLKPAYVDQTFEAVIADPDLAETLRVNEGDPLFLVSSIIYTRDNNPIEFRKAYYRADKYKFHIKRDVI
ncbi:MAG: GntR family transcriptional regulator [Bacillota bacterium]